MNVSVAVVCPAVTVAQARSSASKVPLRSKSTQPQTWPDLLAPLSVTGTTYVVAAVISGGSVTPSSPVSAEFGLVVALGTVALSSVTAVPSRMSERTAIAALPVSNESGASPKSSRVVTARLMPSPEFASCTPLPTVITFTTSTAKVSEVTVPLTVMLPQPAVAWAGAGSPAAPAGSLGELHRDAADGFVGRNDVLVTVRFVEPALGPDSVAPAGVDPVSR